MFPIVEVGRLAPSLARLVIRAPLVARKAKAGHFVIVRVAEGGERIPLTIVDGCPQDGTITLIVQAVGKTTKLLCGLRKGDAISDVVGPLGNPTTIERLGTVACVGGGVGVAELYPIARALRSAGNEVHTFLGARTADLVILERELLACSSRLTVTTDDGTRGRMGLVTAPLRELLEGPHRVAAVHAIGPLPMMKAVADLTRGYRVRTYVSVNPIMVDGTGMCGGCRVTVSGQIRFACVDGPEFDGHEVDFDELMRRNRTYAEEERFADGLYETGVGPSATAGEGAR